MPSRSAMPTKAIPYRPANRPSRLMFRGEKVLSKRSDTALEAIARGTGGTIVKLGLASGDLGTLYESKIEPLARRQHEASRLAGKAERFPLFLLVGLRVAARSAVCRPTAAGTGTGAGAEARLASLLARPWTCLGARRSGRARGRCRRRPAEGSWRSRRSRQWPGERLRTTTAGSRRL